MKETEFKQCVMKKNTLVETKFSIGSGLPKLSKAIINCKQILLRQESIGVEIEVTETMKRVNTIIVNGVEFERKGATDGKAD